MEFDIIFYLAIRAVNSYKVEAIVRALKIGSTSLDIWTKTSKLDFSTLIVRVLVCLVNCLKNFFLQM